MLHGHGPQVRGGLFGPSQLRMKKLTAGFGDHSANTAFGNTILVMCTNARHRDVLVIVFNFFQKFELGKNTVIGAISGDDNITRQREAFEFNLCPNSIGRSQRNLEVDLGQAGSDINKDGAAAELVNVFLTSA